MPESKRKKHSFHSKTKRTVKNSKICARNKRSTENQSIKANDELNQKFTKENRHCNNESELFVQSQETHQEKAPFENKQKYGSTSEASFLQRQSTIEIAATLQEKLMIKDKSKILEEVEALVQNVNNIASTTKDTQRLLTASSKACDFALDCMAAIEALGIFRSCSEILYNYFVDLEFSNLPEAAWCEAVTSSLTSLRLSMRNLKHFHQVDIIFCLCASAFLYSVKRHKNSRESLEEAIKILSQNCFPQGSNMDLYGKACFCMGRQYKAIEEKLLNELSEVRPSTNENEPLSPVFDRSEKADVLLAKQTVKHQDAKKKLKKLETIKKKKEVFKQIDDSLIIALRIANTTNNVKRLVDSLVNTCYVAIENNITMKTLQTLQRCSNIIYDRFAYLAYTHPPSSAFCDGVLKKIDTLMMETLNLVALDNITSTKILVEFHLCLSSFQHSLGWYEDCKKSIDEAIKLLRDCFGKKAKSMTLYGKAYFRLSLYHLTIKNIKAACDCSIKESFDVFYFINRTKPDDTSISDLYSLVFFISVENEVMKHQKLIKHFFTKLLSRSEGHLLKSEQLLINLAIVWLSQFLRNKREIMFKYLKNIALFNLEPPSLRLQSTVTGVIILLIEHSLFSQLPILEKNLFGYAKDLCFRSERLYEKVYFFNALALATVVNKKYKNDSDFYFEILNTGLSEFEKVHSHCECAWICERVVYGHVYLSYAFADNENFDKSLYHANQALQVIDSYKGEYYKKIEFLKVTAHYIAASAFHNKGNLDQSKISLENEISVLEKLDSKNRDGLQEARKHLDYVNKRLLPDPALIEAPEGLIKLFPLQPHQNIIIDVE